MGKTFFRGKAAKNSFLFLQSGHFLNQSPDFRGLDYPNSILTAGSKNISPFSANSLIPDFDNALSVNGTIKSLNNFAKSAFRFSSSIGSSKLKTDFRTPDLVESKKSQFCKSASNEYPDILSRFYSKYP